MPRLDGAPVRAAFLCVFAVALFIAFAWKWTADAASSRADRNANSQLRAESAGPMVRAEDSDAAVQRARLEMRWRARYAVARSRPSSESAAKHVDGITP